MKTLCLLLLPILLMAQIPASNGQAGNAGGGGGGSASYTPLVQDAGAAAICALHADTITGMTCLNTVVDGSAETAFGAGVSIPAGTLSSNTVAVSSSFLFHTSNGTTPTVQVGLRLGGIGGTLIYQAPVVNPVAGVSNFAINVNCTITALTAASSTTPLVVACASINLTVQTFTRNSLLSNTNLSVAANTSITQTLVWTITYSANTVGNAVGLYSMNPGTGGAVGPPGAGSDAAMPHCYKGTAAVSGVNMSVTDAITGGVTNTALAAATTQNLTLFTLPAQGKVVALSIKPSTIFAGGAVSELTMSVGPASCSNAGSAGVAQCYAPSVASGTVQAATGAAYGLFTAVANTNMFDVGGLSSSTFASHAVQVQFTSTGANMSALTSGAVDIRACIVTLP